MDSLVPFWRVFRSHIESARSSVLRVGYLKPIMVIAFGRNPSLTAIRTIEISHTIHTEKHRRYAGITTPYQCVAFHIRLLVTDPIRYQKEKRADRRHHLQYLHFVDTIQRF